jgi:hypothetical protein
MDYIFSRCRGKRTVLMPPDDILKGISERGQKSLARFEITKKQLETHMKNIVLDGYVDYSATSDKAGNMQYVVTLTTRGEAFQRERDDRIKRRWQSLGWKILLTVVAFVVSYGLWYLVGR